MVGFFFLPMWSIQAVQSITLHASNQFKVLCFKCVSFSLKFAPPLWGNLQYPNLLKFDSSYSLSIMSVEIHHSRVVSTLSSRHFYSRVRPKRDLLSLSINWKLAGGEDLFYCKIYNRQQSLIHVCWWGSVVTPTEQYFKVCTFGSRYWQVNAVNLGILYNCT